MIGRYNDAWNAHDVDAIVALHAAGQPVDAVTVADRLRTDGHLGRVGGPAYLHTLISSVPTAANATWYAKTVRRCSALRRVVEAGTRLAQAGYDPGTDPAEVLDACQSDLAHLAASAVGAMVLVTAELVHVDGRLLRFTVTAQDDADRLLANGSVTRVVVDRERFLDRVRRPG